MQLFRGYIQTQGKQPLEKFKGRKNLSTLADVQGLDEYAGVLGNETILIDVDDAPTSDILYQIVQDLKLKCRVYATTRGKHFLFRNSWVEKSWTKQTLALGITTDAKVGKNNTYEVLKFAGVERPILYDTPEDDIQDVPKWLSPVKTNVDFTTLGNGDGRNSTLYAYILTLQDNDFTKEEARETIRLINRYILKEPLSERELEVILRDEAFQKQSFFKGRTFLHDKFATYLKNDNHIIKINGQLHVYQDGIYQSGTEAIERAMIKLIPALKDSQRKETLKQLNLICDHKTAAPPEVIAFSNGLYNLKDDSFKDFTPDAVITNKIPWPYNPAAYNELMNHTLDKISCGKGEIRVLLEEIVGSCFYRSNTLGGGKAFILIGDKSNGKSTLLSVLQSLLGRENTSSLDLKELGDRFKTAELFGKLANIGDDISGDYISNAAVLKKMITGNRINVERKGQDPFEFDNYAKMLFSANDIPTIGKTKEYDAIERRFIFIPFDARFDKTDPDYDPQILNKLKQQDSFEYLIRLGLDGLKRVLKNKGYSEGKASENAKEEYRIEHNSILAFIDELGLDAIVNEPTSAVYHGYNLFCNTNGFEPVKKPTFTKKLLKALNLDVGYGKDRSGKTIKVYVKK